MFSCNCLNIIIESTENDFQNVTSDSLNLSEAEKEDAFFKQDIKQIKLHHINKEHFGLVLSRNVGNWITYQCLTCEIHTHATNRLLDETCLLVSSVLLSEESILRLRNSDMFSNIFNIIVPQRIECLGDVEIEKYSPDVQLALHALEQRVADLVNKESVTVEKRIQLFAEQQYIALNQFKERAQREQQTLSSIILEKRIQPLDLPNNYMVPTFPPNLRLSIEKVPAASSNRNLSPNNEIKSKILTINKNNSIRKAVRQMSTPVCNNSLDSEGLFQFEELDFDQEYLSNEEESDNEESTKIESSSAFRTKNEPPSIAKSLPVNIPNFLSPFGDKDVDNNHDDDLLVGDDHPSDIAASIKALAKSVHGDTVFGDLPKPRFSTQI